MSSHMHVRVGAYARFPVRYQAGLERRGAACPGCRRDGIGSFCGSCGAALEPKMVEAQVRVVDPGIAEDRVRGRLARVRGTERRFDPPDVDLWVPESWEWTQVDLMDYEHARVDAGRITQEVGAFLAAYESDLKGLERLYGVAPEIAYGVIASAW